MIINKILNNNVVTVILNCEEAVVMGRGIGFQKKSGESIDEEKIEKIFKMENEKSNEKFKQLMIETPPEYLSMTKEIVAIAEKELGIELGELIYILLTDHLSFAVIRANENISIENPMLWEIKSLYKKEFKVGLAGINIVEKYTGIRLSEDEAGFIALHILNSALNEDMYNTMNITVLTNKLLNIIKKYFDIKFDEESLDYTRLLTHLKFFAQRIFKREQVEEEDVELYEIISNRYPEERKCIDKIEQYIKKQFSYNLSKQEIIYLIMHIRRFRKN
ncbi:PRD domain-containing protein [Clostridium sardiniense]|uniref:PRD domain-containing protein n=1 Tax=Clostridium sardiniense TaxID=29369 RepID=A0ABS7L2K7_CLOSR|nr:PRD domain-containing protein [Clostridium sardiniense]MBY0757310.1 PRD domain-containing protein [Clostridium sardiniense]MDQ0461722.1 beta-glucoside operon transcriptional antiterminator [Clostridium sardiniense]